MSEVATVGQVMLWMMRHGIATLISGGRDNKFLDTEAGHLGCHSKRTKVSRLIVPFEPKTRYMKNDSIDHNHPQYAFEDFLVPQDNLSIEAATAKAEKGPR